MSTQHQAAGSFGYELHHPAEGDTTTPHRLDVTLRAKPTGEHYDPREMRLTVTDQGEIIEREITPRLSAKMTVRAVAGHVELRDRFDEAVTFFTFGGELSASPEKSLVVCTLTSPAPIIPLYHEPSSAMTMLGVEGEVMLARRRAAWGAKRAAFEARLAQADPFLLYAALLQHIEARFEHFPPDAREDVQDFINFLHRSLRQARRASDEPPSIPAIDDLL